MRIRRTGRRFSSIIAEASCKVSRTKRGGKGRAPDCDTDYFTKILEDDLKAVIKPQYVDQVPKAIKDEDKTVGFQMEKRNQVGQERLDEIVEVLGRCHPERITL